MSYIKKLTLLRTHLKRYKFKNKNTLKSNACNNLLKNSDEQQISRIICESVSLYFCQLIYIKITVPNMKEYFRRKRHLSFLNCKAVWTMQCDKSSDVQHFRHATPLLAGKSRVLQEESSFGYPSTLRSAYCKQRTSKQADQQEENQKWLPAPLRSVSGPEHHKQFHTADSAGFILAVKQSFTQTFRTSSFQYKTAVTKHNRQNNSIHWFKAQRVKLR